MRCDRCGRTAPVLKTCRWRKSETRFTLCDLCWEPIHEVVWVVPGPVPAHGFCPGCSGWFPVGVLSELKPSAYKWDAPTGLCPSCAIE